MKRSKRKERQKQKAAEKQNKVEEPVKQTSLIPYLILTSASVLAIGAGTVYHLLKRPEEKPAVEEVKEEKTENLEKKVKKTSFSSMYLPDGTPLTLDSYMRGFSREYRRKIEKDGFVLVNVLPKLKEHITPKVIAEHSEIVKKTLKHRDINYLGSKIGLNFRKVIDAEFYLPSKKVEENNIRKYVDASIRDFNDFIKDLPLETYIPEVKFPRTKEELLAMEHPSIHFVGAELDVTSIFVDVKGESTGNMLPKRIEYQTNLTLGGGNIYRFLNYKVGDPNSLEIQQEPIRIFTLASKFNYNIFDASPVFEYFHALVTEASAKHIRDEGNKVVEEEGSIPSDGLIKISKKWDKFEEKYVHAQVSVWLEDFLTKNDNMGLNDDEVKELFKNLDKEPYVGARQLMPKIRELGPKKAYELYLNNPKELFD